MKIYYPLMRPLMNFGWHPRLRRFVVGHNSTAEKFRGSFRFGPEVVLCDRNDLLTMAEAARILERVNVRFSIFRGYLDPAYAEDGSCGVSRESVTRELEWCRSATLLQRTWRKVKSVLNGL